jgi:hypothetical protein
MTGNGGMFVCSKFFCSEQMVNTNYKNVNLKKLVRHASANGLLVSSLREVAGRMFSKVQ